jgi:hypothetical protein
MIKLVVEHIKDKKARYTLKPIELSVHKPLAKEKSVFDLGEASVSEQEEQPRQGLNKQKANMNLQIISPLAQSSEQDEI